MGASTPNGFLLCFGFNNINNYLLNSQCISRKKTGAKMREPAASKKPRRVRKNLQETNSFTKLASKEVYVCVHACTVFV